MRKLNFGYADHNGVTIYRKCFQQYIKARFILNKSKAEWSKIVLEIEEVFELLVAEGRKFDFDVASILEIPDSSGSTCFHIASQCSKKISQVILETGIKLNSINIDMMVPDFAFPDLAVSMMSRGINPRVISSCGKSQIDLFPSSFESKEAENLLAQFPESVHFSIDQIDCEENCPSDCESRFDRFYCKNGSLIEMTDDKRIGRGGFGMVFRELFHGKPMAMKCELVRELKHRQKIEHAVSDLHKNLLELRIKVADVKYGVIVPVAFIRQQNIEKDHDDKWIARNYNIYVYPLYDCNLYELHETYFSLFTAEIVTNIAHQSLKRNDFKPCMNVMSTLGEVYISYMLLLYTHLFLTFIYNFYIA